MELKINQTEREQLLFLLLIKDTNSLKEVIITGKINNDIFLERINYVFKRGLDFIEYDQNDFPIYAYHCTWCGYGLHDKNRLCRNKKYFKHKLDCPVLIAKDFKI